MSFLYFSGRPSRKDPGCNNLALTQDFASEKRFGFTIVQEAEQNGSSSNKDVCLLLPIARVL